MVDVSERSFEGLAVEVKNEDRHGESISTLSDWLCGRVADQWW